MYKDLSSLKNDARFMFVAGGTCFATWFASLFVGHNPDIPAAIPIFFALLFTSLGGVSNNIYKDKRDELVKIAYTIANSCKWDKFDALLNNNPGLKNAIQKRIKRDDKKVRQEERKIGIPKGNFSGYINPVLDREARVLERALNSKLR